MAMLMIECNVSYEESGSVAAAGQIVRQAQALTTDDRCILWLRSWAADNKVYCLFDAVSAEHLRQIALQRDFRFHRLLAVTEISQVQ